MSTAATTFQSRRATASRQQSSIRGLLQRKCACGSPTSSFTGECEERKSRGRLQTELIIGASDDPLEREADWVAEQVLAAGIDPAIKSTRPHIQRHGGVASEGVDTAPASVDRALASPGRPLEPALRQDMEQRFSHDFSRVRIHSHTAAEQSAREVNAHAYTVGHNADCSATAPKCTRRQRVARLMRKEGLQGVSRRRAYIVTTRRNERERPAPDLVQRRFYADSPGWQT